MMRNYRMLVVAGLLVCAPATAIGQTPTPAAQASVDFDEPAASHWVASGFVGSNFGQDSDEASVDFGGTIGYLWNGVFGAEFQANLSPEFALEGRRSALLLGDQPWINSYMANAIGAVPIGDRDGAWQPYVSGGVGVLALRSDVLITDGEQNDLRPDDTRFAGNIGAGAMGFLTNNVGIRGDVRYFRGFDAGDELDPVESPAEAIGTQVLSDLAFWRANIGVAFRW